MPSLKCLTAHIFKKVAITEHCFVGNFLYQICFQIGRKMYKMLENFHLRNPQLLKCTTQKSPTPHFTQRS
jgi:hypothetical protein